MNRIKAQANEGFSSESHYIFISTQSRIVQQKSVHHWDLLRPRQKEKGKKRKRNCCEYREMPVHSKNNEGVWRKWWERGVCMCVQTKPASRTDEPLLPRSWLGTLLWKTNWEDVKEGTWATHTLAPWIRTNSALVSLAWRNRSSKHSSDRPAPYKACTRGSDHPAFFTTDNCDHHRRRSPSQKPLLFFPLLFSSFTSP